MLTGDAYSSGHLVLSLLGLAFVLLVETSDFLYRLDIIPVFDIITGLKIILNLTFHNIGFHRASATGVACRQGTLTPPDTWSRPFGTCIYSSCWDQSFSELVVILPDYALRISFRIFSILLCVSFVRMFLWIRLCLSIIVSLCSFVSSFSCVYFFVFFFQWFLIPRQSSFILF